jgi:hypothetical protein
LASIVPSHDGDLAYCPCRITLRNGAVIDSVYIEPEKPYFRSWGVRPEHDQGKRAVRIEDVVKAEDSPAWLPAEFANEIYRHGESGMGYTIFPVVFSDGTRQACGSGNAVDFVRCPERKGPKDGTQVISHEGRNAHPVSAPDGYWCQSLRSEFSRVPATWPEAKRTAMRCVRRRGKALLLADPRPVLT